MALGKKELKKDGEMAIWDTESAEWIGLGALMTY